MSSSVRATPGVIAAKSDARMGLLRAFVWLDPPLLCFNSATAAFVNAFAVIVIASFGHAFTVSVEPSQDLEFDRTIGVRRGLREEPVRFGKLEIGER